MSVRQIFWNSIRVVKNILAGQDLFLTGQPGPPGSPPDDIDITTYQALRLDKANAALYVYADIGGQTWFKVGGTGMICLDAFVETYDHITPYERYFQVNHGSLVVVACWLVNFDLLNTPNINLDINFWGQGGSDTSYVKVKVGSSAPTVPDGSEVAAVHVGGTGPLHGTFAISPRPSGRQLVQLVVDSPDGETRGEACFLTFTNQ